MFQSVALPGAREAWSSTISCESSLKLFAAGCVRGLECVIAVSLRAARSERSKETRRHAVALCGGRPPPRVTDAQPAALASSPIVITPCDYHALTGPQASCLSGRAAPQQLQAPAQHRGAPRRTGPLHRNCRPWQPAARSAAHCRLLYDRSGSRHGAGEACARWPMTELLPLGARETGVVMLR